MWGICLDVMADGGKLYQRAIEYEETSDKCTVHILQPVSDIKISVDKIMPVDKPPVFVYGELVSIVEHSGTIGRIRDIIWHFKNHDYNYYITINHRKKSKRYDSDELLKFDGQHLVGGGIGIRRMQLSIIVPVYNMAADGKLNYCMDSLVNQTISDYEIIAVDDASTDHSLEILREYERKYPGKVRVITYPVNRRQGGAKNEGLRAASGEWIGFIDSDDWIAYDYYEKLLKKAAETGADMVGCDYCLVGEHTYTVGKIVRNNDLDQTGVLDEEKHKKLFLRPGSMVIKIYKGDVIRKNGLMFPEGIFYEDNCAGSLWSLYFERIEKVEEPLYYYYQHDFSTVHYITEEKCRDRMTAMELLYEECRKRGFAEGYYQELEYRFAELYYVITLFSYLQGVKRPRLDFVKELRWGVAERFPEFEKNPYYCAYTGQEEQKLIAMQAKSDVRFYWYYRLKQVVRRLRNRG